jgi:hypothetical protein
MNEPIDEYYYLKPIEPKNKPMTPIYSLGQKVTTMKYLKRISKFVQDGDTPWKQEFKVWDERTFKSPVEGIVIGVRNLSNGKNHYLGSEEGMSYEPKEHFKAIIVDYQLYRKPILVKI